MCAYTVEEQGVYRCCSFKIAYVLPRPLSRTRVAVVVVRIKNRSRAARTQKNAEPLRSKVSLLGSHQERLRGASFYGRLVEIRPFSFVSVHFLLSRVFCGVKFC